MQAANAAGAGRFQKVLHQQSAQSLVLPFVADRDREFAVLRVRITMVKADIESQSLSAIHSVFDRLGRGDVSSRVVLDFAKR